jgi:hypothetical protein
MNKLLLLFIILLLGLILCSFLGGNCYNEGFTTDITTITGVKGNKAGVAVTSSGDVYTASNINGNVNASSYPSSSSSSSPSSTSYDNYNHYNQTSYPTKYYGPNGTTATIINTNGTYTLAISETNGTTTVYNVDKPKSENSSTDTSSSSISKTTFYGQNGGTAKVTTDNNGDYLIKVTQPDGTTTVYTVTNTQSTVVPPPQQPVSSTATYSSGQNYSYYNGQNVNAGSVTTPSGTTYTLATGPQGNTAVTSSNSNSAYDSTLPPGVPKSMIPSGQEDLYILKSQVVPPVCPASPACGTNLPHKPSDQGSPDSPPSTSSISSYFSSPPSSSEKCPPCPSCARCPEPAFDCKKVPNYNSVGSSKYLPMPVMSDFSTFGM